MKLNVILRTVAAVITADEDSIPAGETNGVKTACIPSPLGGTYTAVLTGTASGNYTLDAGVYWPGNSDTNQTTTGTTDVGVMSTNTVFVVTPPVVVSTSVNGGMFNLSFTAQTNITYVLEGRNSLMGTNWAILQSLTATGTVMATSQSVTGPMMFYRVRSQ